MKKIINWKTFLILFIACLITSVLVIPYQVALVPELSDLGIMLYASALVQAAVIFSIVTFTGLLLAPKTNFKLPILEGKDLKKELKKILLPGIIWGVISGVLIIIFSLLFADLSLEIAQPVPILTSFLASFYGGIAEEVLMRLFVMTLLVWIILKLSKKDTKEPTKWSIWLAILISSVLFGIGHLPITSAITEINLMVVVRAIVLNGIGGVIFGLLYWKKGLEAAIIAHFSADIVLHVMLPIVLRIL